MKNCMMGDIKHTTVLSFQLWMLTLMWVMARRSSMATSRHTIRFSVF